MSLSVTKAIITKKLCLQDAAVMEEVFKQQEIDTFIPAALRIPGQSINDFVKRLLWRCEFCWSVRLRKQPKQVIGFVLLYNRNKKLKDVYVSCFMLPEFNNKHLVINSLNAGIEIAKHLLDVQTINYTVSNNDNMVQILRSIGFSHSHKEPGILSRPAEWKVNEQTLVSKKRTRKETGSAYSIHLLFSKVPTITAYNTV